MLDEWLLRSRKRLPRTDYAILVLIFVTIIFLGFPEGVGIGMAITTVLFAVRLGRVDSVEAEFTARERPSHRTRSIADRAILLAEGGRVRAYRLRGYIFFGSTCRADLHVCRQCRHHAPKLRGECDHDRADRVIDKTSANYCAYFRPARGAWRGDADAGRERAQDDLAELFGLEPESPQSAAESSRKAVADARRELDALFGPESKPDAESTGADSEVRDR